MNENKTDSAELAAVDDDTTVVRTPELPRDAPFRRVCPVCQCRTDDTLCPICKNVSDGSDGIVQTVNIAPTLYARVRKAVARMDASIQSESTKEEYLKRVFDDVTALVMAETLVAVSEHCESRGEELWATGEEHNKHYAAAYYTLQDWCVDQIENEMQPLSEASGSVPSEAP